MMVGALLRWGARRVASILRVLARWKSRVSRNVIPDGEDYAGRLIALSPAGFFIVVRVDETSGKTQEQADRSEGYYRNAAPSGRLWSSAMLFHQPFTSTATFLNHPSLLKPRLLLSINSNPC